jgi:HSP20 family protein
MLVPRNSTRLPVLRGNVGIDRLFDDLFDGFPFGSTSWETPLRAFPAVNSWEDEKSYHLEAELPGLSEKDVEITVLGNELRISGGREETIEKKDEKTTYHRRERYVGKFSRVFRFPVDVDESKVKAKFVNGVLEITMPKAEAALPRRIEVKAS